MTFDILNSLVEAGSRLSEALTENGYLPSVEHNPVACNIGSALDMATIKACRPSYLKIDLFTTIAFTEREQGGL